MTKHVCIFTPTVRYGGLDMALASVRRQELPDDTKIMWIVCDSCPENRQNEILSHMHPHAIDGSVIEVTKLPFAYSHAPLGDNTKSNLCLACNQAIRMARAVEADLLISL